MDTTQTNHPESKFLDRFSPAIGLVMSVRVRERFADLYAAADLPQNEKLEWHLRENILPGLALYQTLREDGKSQEEALESMDAIFETGISDSRRKMKTLGRIPIIYPLLRVVIKRIMRQYPPDGWETEWAENSGQAVRFNMKSCFYYNTLSHYGAPELTASFCRLDDLVYGEMSPYLDWKRSQTIGRGQEFCDFCFAPAPRK